MKFPSPVSHFILHPSSFILYFPGCGVTPASEFWKLVVTVQFCPPGPRDRTQKPEAGNKEAPEAQLDGCDASNVEVVGSNPTGSARSNCEG